MASPWEGLPAYDARPDTISPPGTVTPPPPPDPTTAGSPWTGLPAYDAPPGTGTPPPPPPPPAPETYGPPAPTAPYDFTKAGAHQYTFGLSDLSDAAFLASQRYFRGETPGFDFSEPYAEIQRGREAFEKEHPAASLAANVAGAITNPVAGPAMTAIKAASLPGKIAVSTGAGGLIGGVQGAAEHATSVPEAVEGAKTGAEWGGGIGAAFPAVAKIGGYIFPPLTSAARTLLGADVTPTPGTAVGGLPGLVEKALSYVPLVGGPIKAAKTEVAEQLPDVVAQQAKDFVRGAVNEPLAVIGEKLNENTAPGRAAIGELQTKLSNAFNQAVPTAGGVLDGQASKMLSDSVANAKLNLRDSEAGQFEKFVQTNVTGKIAGTTAADATTSLNAATAARQQAEADLAFAQNQQMHNPGPSSAGNIADATQRVQQASAAETQAQSQLHNVQMGAPPAATLSGQDVQDVDRALGNEAHKFLQSPDPYHQDLGNAYLNLQGQMRDWLERASPPDVAAKLKAANDAWRMAKPVQDAARRTNNPDGLFTPTQLTISSRAASSPTQFAAGGGLMQPFAAQAEKDRLAFARLGKQMAPQGESTAHAVGGGVLGAEALSHMIQHGIPSLEEITGALAAHPFLTGGVAAGWPLTAAAYSEPGRRAITGLLGQIGKVPPAVAPFGPVAGQLASGLLNYNQQPQP
jgi:hypothetical protein